MEQLAAFLASQPPKLVAVGEIGLDLTMENPQFERQQRLLHAQLALAKQQKQHRLPVILHSRRTHDQLAAVLRRLALPRCGVVHGFAGSWSQAQAFVRLGYYIGVGGTISYPRAQKTRSVMAQLPLSSLLLETDALICRWPVIKGSRIAQSALPRCFRCCAACDQSQPMR